MNVVLCWLGRHDWDGCKCRRCGDVRLIDESLHDWDGCECNRCGRRKPASDKAHDWDGCKCRKCGLTNKDAEKSKHDWNRCKCRRCGKVEHTWQVTNSESGSYRVGGGASYDNREWRKWTRVTYTCAVCGEKDTKEDDWDADERSD